MADVRKDAARNVPRTQGNSSVHSGRPYPHHRCAMTDVPHGTPAHRPGWAPLCMLLINKFSSSTSTAPQFLNSTMIDAIVPTTIANNNTASTSNDNPNNFQLYQHHGINTPQMNFSNLSGFLSRDGGASASSAAAQHDDLSMWKSGETVRNNDPIQQNLPELNNNNIGSQNYNLNVSEKERRMLLRPLLKVQLLHGFVLPIK